VRLIIDFDCAQVFDRALTLSRIGAVIKVALRGYDPVKESSIYYYVVLENNLRDRKR